ncbi:ATP-binding protein [Massilia sp. DWR3-1-1]|uniref:HAMP domain-containing sensor histidine kinase n=1 Tax=Massilia sp. DWR3-1-1 TaxID=2804559 RepID=UPI003CE9BBD0
MGRLFWKFFLAIFLAQVVASLGVGVAFWLRSQTQDVSREGAAVLDTGNRAGNILDAAAIAYKYGKLTGLRDFLQTGAGSSLVVLDAAGTQLQARAVSAALVAQATSLLGTPSAHAVVRHFAGEDGQRLTAFVIHGAGRGGFPGAGPRLDARAFVGPPPMFGGGGGDPVLAASALKGGPLPGMDGGPRGGPRFPYITIVVGLLASFVFAAALAWTMSRPIRALRTAFAAAASGDLTPRFAHGKAGKGDELVELGPEFDRMSGKLWALMDNQQRLLHDVSHELRSPLARLHAAIGLAHQNPDKLASSLARIERESNRMDKLVGELLTLSRLDSAINLPPLEEVAIGELVHEIATEADFEAELSGRRVQFLSLADGAAGNGAAAAQVTGSPDLLWRGIENIVRNGVKYSPPGGVVEIEVQQTLANAGGAGRVFIRVRDRGPGVPEAHLATIFQPFFRSDPSSNNVDGHGLGLAIAQRVIAAHGGVLGARNRIGGGLCVTIELPCKGPTPA